MKTRSTQSPFIRVIKKFFYSAFVAVTFILYALENRGTAPVSSTPAAGGAVPTPASSAFNNNGASSANGTGTGGNAPSTGVTEPTATTPAPTSTSSAAANSSGLKDGTYTGPEVDIRWGNVQVQATVKSGQIANVQVVEYPTERRTSARINSTAVPELQQEAVQAQSANVNIITGATLTSEGFQQSLQAALSQAKG